MRNNIWNLVQYGAFKSVIYFPPELSPPSNNHWKSSIMHHHLISILLPCPPVIKSRCSLSLSVPCTESIAAHGYRKGSYCHVSIVYVQTWVTQVRQKLPVTVLQVETDYSARSLQFRPSQQRITGVLLMRASFFLSSWRETVQGKIPREWGGEAGHCERGEGAKGEGSVWARSGR